MFIGGRHGWCMSACAYVDVYVVALRFQGVGFVLVASYFTFFSLRITKFDN